MLFGILVPGSWLQKLELLIGIIAEFLINELIENEIFQFLHQAPIIPLCYFVVKPQAHLVIVAWLYQITLVA